MIIGQVVFLAVLLAVAVGFIRGSVAFWRYGKLLRDDGNETGAALRRTLPKWATLMRIVMPVTAVGLAFSGAAATIAFVYFSTCLLLQNLS